MPEHLATEAVLAANEPATDTVEHAYGTGSGSLVVSASIDEDELRVSVEDDGSWKDPGDAATSGRGCGFAIMRGMMDDVAVLASNTGATVEMARRLEGTLS